MSAAVQVGSYLVGSGQPLLLIAGNCVVESLETALRTAEVVQREATRRTLNPVFKASFDKANRTRRDSHRGPGMDAGLEVLAQVKKQTGLPILTDVHLPSHCEAAAQVADVLQIPAFLCRQTDLLEAAAATGRVVNIKKGQFVGPEAMQHAVAKIHEAGQPHALLTERGSSFGYGDLIVDYRGFSTLRSFAPLIFDATHSAQKPAGSGGVTGGTGASPCPLRVPPSRSGLMGSLWKSTRTPSAPYRAAANSLDFDLFTRLLDDVVRLREA